MFLLIALFILSVSQETIAQSANKIAGKWESVFRKGKRNCDFDYILTFELDGKASIVVGSRFSECESYTTDATRWEMTKKEGPLNGKTKNWDVIKLTGPDGSKNIIIEVFEGDYMKIHMKVVSLNTTTVRAFIMKKSDIKNKFGLEFFINC